MSVMIIRQVQMNEPSDRTSYIKLGLCSEATSWSPFAAFPWAPFNKINFDWTTLEKLQIKQKMNEVQSINQCSLLWEFLKLHEMEMMCLRNHDQEWANIMCIQDSSQEARCWDRGALTTLMQNSTVETISQSFLSARWSPLALATASICWRRGSTADQFPPVKPQREAKKIFASYAIRKEQTTVSWVKSYR